MAVALAWPLGAADGCSDGRLQGHGRCLHPCRLRVKDVQNRQGVDHFRIKGNANFAVGAQQFNIQRCMIGLPDGVRSIGFAPVNKLERVAVRFRAFMGKSNQVGWQSGDDAVDNPIARWGLA